MLPLIERGVDMEEPEHEEEQEQRPERRAGGKAAAAAAATNDEQKQDQNPPPLLLLFFLLLFLPRHASSRPSRGPGSPCRRRPPYKSGASGNFCSLQKKDSEKVFRGKKKRTKKSSRSFSLFPRKTTPPPTERKKKQKTFSGASSELETLSRPPSPSLREKCITLTDEAKNGTEGEA